MSKIDCDSSQLEARSSQPPLLAAPIFISTFVILKISYEKTIINARVIGFFVPEIIC